MVTGLAGRFDGTLLFALEEFNQLGNRRFFDPEALLAGMCGRVVKVSEPG
jgi:hypothetical protein